MKKQLLPIATIIVIILILSLAGGTITRNNMGWYHNLNLPSFTPPGSVIGTVWTILYILCGIAAFRIWNWPEHGKHFKTICAVAAVNVILNLSWSYCFFGMHLMTLSIIVCAILAITAAIIVAMVWPRDRISAGILVLYVLWLMFATFLTWSVTSLN